VLIVKIIMCEELEKVILDYVVLYLYFKPKTSVVFFRGRTHTLSAHLPFQSVQDFGLWTAFTEFKVILQKSVQQKFG
jgi:hypothetical protein